MPVFDGSGNEIGGIHEGTGSGIQTVYQGDGTVLWSAGADGELYNEGAGEDNWEGYGSGDGTQELTKLETELRMLASDTSSSQSNEALFATSSEYDLSDYNQIEIRWYNNGTFDANVPYNWSHLIVSDNQSSNYTNYVERLSRSSVFGDESSQLTDTLDISNLSGSYYIRCHAYSDSYIRGTIDSDLYVSRVELIE